MPFDSKIIMGHTRMTTKGNEKNNFNNHPFFGRAGSTNFALAHNGVLHNDELLRKTIPLPRTKIETDSFVAVQLLQRYNAITIESLAEMAETVSGTFCFSKGTLKANTILATIQLVHRICQMAKFSSDEEITSLSWPSFVEQIRDPELIQYLKERRLYINEVTGEDSDEC